MVYVALFTCIIALILNIICLIGNIKEKNIQASIGNGGWIIIMIICFIINIITIL